MNEIIEGIKESKRNQGGDDEEIQEASKTTWLIFSIHGKKYAVEATLAKEILRDMDIYPLPFVPEYIKGVINRHGEPYTIVDLSIFLGEEPQDSSLFIVLNLEDNQFCIQISDVLDFHTVDDESIIKVSEAQDTPFYSGAIEYNGSRVPVILLDKIYNEIRTNLETFS